MGTRHHSTSSNTKFLDLTLGYLGCASSEKWDLNQKNRRERETGALVGFYMSGSEPQDQVGCRPLPTTGSSSAPWIFRGSVGVAGAESLPLSPTSVFG